MSEQPITSVLRKMLAQDEPVAAEVPLTVARALRLSAARAAEKSVGLKLTVQSVSEEILKLDELIGRISNDLLLLQLHRDVATGLAAIDAGLVAAIVESQTMGKLSEAQPKERPMTAVDASLAEPLVAGLLAEMKYTTSGTALEGWIDDICQKGQYLDLRQIGLTLPEASYRLLQMTIDLSVNERAGAFYFALPMPQSLSKPSEKDEDRPEWSVAFPETVGLSQASLPVILQRFNAPLSSLEDLKVGQVLNLPRCRVDNARLEMSDGTLVARGRLGQMSGHLALRLEDPVPDVLQDLSGVDAQPPANEPLLPNSPEDLPTLDISMEAGDAVDLGLPDLDVPVEGTEGPEPSDLGALDAGSELEVQDEDLGGIDLSTLGGIDAGLDADPPALDDGPEIDLSSIDFGSLGTD